LVLNIAPQQLHFPNYSVIHCSEIFINIYSNKKLSYRRATPHVVGDLAKLFKITHSKPFEITSLSMTCESSYWYSIVTRPTSIWYCFWDIQRQIMACTWNNLDYLG